MATAVSPSASVTIVGLDRNTYLVNTFPASVCDAYFDPVNDDDGDWEVKYGRLVVSTALQLPIAFASAASQNRPTRKLWNWKRKGRVAPRN